MLMFRRDHEAVVRAVTARAERAETRVDALEAQLADLTAKFTDAVTPKPVPALPKPEPDPILEAIRYKAGANGALRSHLATYAREQRLLGKDDDTLITELLDWSKATPSDVPAFFG